MSLTIHEFIKQLRLNKIYTSKQSIVLENIYVYFNNLYVYKVFLQVNPSMMKKADKLGIKQLIFNFDNTYKLHFEEDTTHKLDKGRFIASYNVGTTACAIYPGEDTTEDIAKNILKY